MVRLRWILALIFGMTAFGCGESDPVDTSPPDGPPGMMEGDPKNGPGGDPSPPPVPEEGGSSPGWGH